MDDLPLPGSIRNNSSSLAAKTAGTVAPTIWQGSLTAGQVRARRSQAILTPVPAGQRWRLKSLHGEAVELLPAVFASRLEALGAGVLLARQCDAELVP